MAGVALHFADQRQGIRPVYPGGPGREVLVSCAVQVGTVLDATVHIHECTALGERRCQNVVGVCLLLFQFPKVCYVTRT